MRVTFYGGAEEVGRSCIMLEEGRKRLLLDCGVKLGEKTEFPLIEDYELRKIRDIAVSHAHLDHVGYLPHVFAKGARPRVLATKPTRDLMGVLLADYNRLQTLGGRRKRFAQKDVDSVLKNTEMVEYNENIRAGFPLSFHHAGHIMGSAMMLVKEKGGILYTGDICARKTRILDPCQRGLRAKTLIMESTYGRKGDSLPSYKTAGQKLVKLINKTLDRGGHVLIPSFAVGRAQEVLMLLDDYMRSGALAESKIFIEGMIGKAMRIYRHNAIYANDDIKRRILMSEDDPFKSKAFHYPKFRNRYDVLSEPSIIVSTSGMLSGGPALFYLEKLGPDPKNTLIFVGYQARGTRGKRVLEGEKRIKIKDKEINLKMEIDRVRISGHADYNELTSFTNSVKGLEKIFVIHGERPDIIESLSKKYEVVAPRLLETYGI